MFVLLLESSDNLLLCLVSDHLYLLWLILTVCFLVGSGYTVEGQKTGEEKHGGIQLEIIPSYTRGLRNWLKEETPEVLNDPYAFLDELRTPEQLGLKTGDKILSYAEEAFYSRPHTVGDLILQDSSGHDIDPISVKVRFIMEIVHHDPVLQTLNSSRHLIYQNGSR